MKKLCTISFFLLTTISSSIAQNTLDNAGLTSASPSSVSYSLRKLSSTYTGYILRVRRSNDNALADVSFDGSSTISNSSNVKLVEGVNVGALTGTIKTGTISTGTSKTGTISVQINKTGTITVGSSSITVTGTGTLFTTELSVGDRLYNSSNAYVGVVASIASNTSLTLAAIAFTTFTNGAFRNQYATVNGLSTLFTTEFAVGDRLFNAGNTYLGTVAVINSNTSLFINLRDAVTASNVSYSGNSVNITGSGTLFTTELNVGDMLISNGTTLGIVASITSNTALVLSAKSGLNVTSLTYKSTTGTIAFNTFYGSNSVYVNVWYDQSGSGRDMFQYTNGNQPRVVNAGVINTKNSKPTMEFSSSLFSYLYTNLAATYMTGSPYTVNKVSAEALSNPNNQYTLSTQAGAGPNNSVFQFGYRSSFQLTLAHYGNDQNYYAAPANTLEVNTGVKTSGAGSSFYKNGASLGSGSSPSSLLGNVGPLNIGYYMGANSYYNGTVSEVILFPSVISNTERSNMELNQLSYYTISTTTWNGSINTDWSNASNWSNGVPTSTSPTMVIIPNVSNKPIITGIQQAISISIMSGAQLTINGTLQFSGAITNNGTFTASSGTLELNGSVGQVLNTSSTIQNLVINNAANVTLMASQTISGNLNLNAGKLILNSYNLNIGGNIVNNVTGGIRGSSNSSMTLTSAAGATLSFDQSTLGTTNVLNSLTVNTIGQTITLSNTLNITGNLFITAGTLDIGSNTINRTSAGGTLTISSNGTMKIGGSGSLPNNYSTHSIASGSTIDFSGASQNIGALNSSQNYSILKLSGSGIVTLTSPITISNTLNINGPQFYDNGNQITSSGTLTLISGSFKLGTVGVATTFPAFATNTISTGTAIEFASGVAQTVSSSPQYKNLTLSGGGTKTAGGNITVNGILTNGGVFDLTSAYILSGTLSSISNSGTIKIGIPTSVSSTPIPISKTWNGTVEFTGTSAQTLVAGNFSNLSVSGIGGITASGSVSVSGVLYLYATNPSATKGIISMPVSDTLTMLNTATMNGTGDVSGVVKRTGFVNNTPYSFGNLYTTITLTGGTLPNDITLNSIIGVTPSGKDSAVARNYELVLHGGSGGTLNANFHFLDAELTSSINGFTNTESKMVTWDYDFNGGSSTPDEHGRSAFDFANNYVGMANIPYSYFQQSWRTLFTLGNYHDNEYKTWNGSADASWTNSANWTPAGVPVPGTRVIIPDSSTTIFDPAIMTTEIRTLSVLSGGYLNLGSASLTINGASGAFEDLSNGVYPSNSTIIFSGAGATISGLTTFNNIIINDSCDVTIQNYADVKILGSISKVGIAAFYAGVYNSTLEFSGGSQSVTQSSSTPNYYHLKLNGTGAKNIPFSFQTGGNLEIGGTASFTAQTFFTINGSLVVGSGSTFIAGSYAHHVAGDVTIDGTLNLAGSTICLNGSVQQNINSSLSFNNLIINNSAAVNLLNNVSVNGTLTFTNGKINIGSNTLTIGGTIVNTISGGLTGSSSSNLTINSSSNVSLSFDQTTIGVSNLLNNLTLNSSGKIISLLNDLSVNANLIFTAGKFNIGSNSLTINGSIINTSSQGLIGGNTSNLSINGTGSITLSFDQTTLGTTNKLNNLTVSRGTSPSTGTVILNDSLNIVGTVSIQNGTFNTNGTLVLLSTGTTINTPSTTARIATIGANADITGNVTVQRFIGQAATPTNATRRYRMLSSPVQNFTWEQLIDDIYVTGNSSSTGFDMATNSSVFTYEENVQTGRGWKAPSSVSSSVSAGTGLLVFVRGDRTIGSPAYYTAPYPAQNAVTLDFVGQPVNKGAIDAAISFTDTGVPENDGWNLVGNPYPSTIDWSLIAKTNISEYFYMYDPMTGSYVANSAGTISLGQSFFIQANGASPAFQFNETDKVPDAQLKEYFKMQTSNLELKMIKDSFNSDIAFLNSDLSSSPHYDRMEDAIKFPNSFINFGFLVDSVKLQRNSLPLTGTIDTIVLFANSTAGNFTIEAKNLFSIPSNKNVVLVDLYTSNRIDLRSMNTYSFTINTDSLSYGNRFLLLIGSSQLLPVQYISLTATPINNDVLVAWKTMNEKDCSHFIVERSNNHLQFDEIALLHSTSISNVISTYQFIDNAILAKSINNIYYRIKEVDKNGEYFLSEILEVKVRKQILSNEISIYPNPAKDFIIISSSVFENENVTIYLYNSEGNEMSEFQITKLSGNNLKLSLEHFSAGFYYIKVKSNSGNIITHKFIVE